MNNDIENMVREELRKGRSFVTPGGLKHWPMLDAFNAIVIERDEALRTKELARRRVDELESELDEAYRQAAQADEALVMMGERCRDVEIENARLRKALETICDIGETRDVEVARDALHGLDES